MRVAHRDAVHIQPVHHDYFADPFVWQYEGVYYAIGTGLAEATGQVKDKAFPILKSDDLFKWEFAGNALLRPAQIPGSHFWAPEVACHNGKFFLYYSVGLEDTNHQLRVAASDSPTGPYVDTGSMLVDPGMCPFAIDAHPFQDGDGQWYLFYARNFLDESPACRAGTALMVARMRSMTELEDPGRVVLRARCDWQRFEARRTLYGREWDWHTLEGPCVRKHDGRYFCFYSGGRWENESYGVDYGIADSVLGPYSDAGNENGPRVLRTIPGALIGPGHNSVVTEPEKETDYIVYHAWDPEMTARRMHVSRLHWTPEGPRCEG